MPSIQQQIRDKAVELLESNPKGLRYQELINNLKEGNKNWNPNTIAGAIWNLDKTRTNEIAKPARGLFIHVSKISGDGETGEEKRPTITEGNFYEPFADYLVNELEECSKAIKLGGAKFPEKWGTPDVVGYKEAARGQIYQPPLEIVTAEIKADRRDLITAFGQACAYKLFSHKSYIVIPNNAAPEDIGRLDALSMIFGIGLIVHSNEPDNAQFGVKVRARRHEPDIFYVNKFLDKIGKTLFGKK